jgi:phosphatidylinositol alpha-mannosyltransferase
MLFMNIAFVSPYDFAYPGGVNNHIENLAREFQRRGHHVTIVAPSSKPAAQVNAPNFYPIGRPVPIRTAGSVARITFSVWRYSKVKAFFRNHQFDIVHVHEPLVPMLGCFAVLCANSVNVATFHQYRERSFFYPLAHTPIRAALDRRLHGRIAVSKPAAQFIGQWFPGDYRIIPNGIDLDHFQRTMEPFPQFMDGRPNILFVGRSEKRKGLKYLVAAFGRLKWQMPDARLIVVGPGNPDPDTLRVIGERAIQDVVFTGGVSYRELPRYYRSAHVFCAPSTGGESFGIVLLEAMAAGAPVVASDIAGYATVVTHNQNGLLVKPKDEASITEGLLTALAQPELRRRLSESGRAFVHQFTWERVADQVLDYYEELLTARAPAVRRVAPSPA